MIYRSFFKNVHLQYLQKSVETGRHLHLLLYDRRQKINADRNPDLGLDRIGRSPVKSIDPEMSLDPFEKQFHSPTQAVDIRYSLSAEVKVVGQEEESSVVFGIVISHPAERFEYLGDVLY